MRFNSNTNVLFCPFLLPVLAALTTISACAPLTAKSQNLVTNGSFEVPGRASDQYTVTFQTLPTNYVIGWLLGPSGIASLPSQSPGGNDYDGICGGNGLNDAANYEDGTNCIFLQGGMAATTVTLSNGLYTLSLWAMGRVDAGNGANPVWVTLGNARGMIFSNTVTPQNTAQNALGDWTQYLFNFSAPSNGTYSLVFQSAIPYGSGHDHMTFIDNVSIVANTATNLVANGSFETVTPPVTSSVYTTSFGSLATNAVANWAFGASGGSAYDGIVTSGGFGVQDIEDGDNAAFVQGTGLISQNREFPAGSYSLSFYAIGRTSANGGNGADPITVSVGNLLNQIFTPDNVEEDSINDWTEYSYDFNVPSGGTYMLQFSGNDPFVSGSDDHMTIIDNVSIVAIPAIPPPTIVSEPSAQQVLYVGQSAQFTVQTGSAPPVFYQWQVETNGIYVNLINGGRISGAVNATLIISNLNTGDSTNYMVSVTNSGGTTNSTVAALAVLPLPPPGSPRNTVTVINPSFEDNQMTNDSYTTGSGTLNPQTGIPGWQFSSSGGDSYSGIVTESGTIFGTPKYIPQCWQAAFIQGTGQFSQSVTFKSSGTNVVRFWAEGWNGAGAGADPIEVSVDGNGIGTFTPLTTQWSLYTSPPFGMTSGVHLLAFSGAVPFSISERTSFIDGVEIVTPAEAAAVVPSTSPVYNIVFIGDSITYGATLADPATQASAVQCMQSLGTRFNMAMRMSNQGHSGATTFDWLPSSPYNTGYFEDAVDAAAALETNQPGQLIFSIMLGANDSAQSGTDGCPVSPSEYLTNLESIVDQLLADYSNAFVFVHYPTWYSTNTHNGAVYDAAGLARLQTYFSEIDQLVSDCAVSHPGLVFAGDKLAFNNFSNNYLTEMTPESGVEGTFYLHPNALGATLLGGFWANAIVSPLNVTSNNSYIAWLQSSDLTPGAPGTGFYDRPTNSLVPNGDSYGDPDGLTATLTNGPTTLDVSADIRDDTNLTIILEDSSDLINWNSLAWAIATNQNGVATGFVRHTAQIPIDYQQQKTFYRLALTY